MFIFHDGKKPACFLHAGFFQRFYDIYKSKQGSYLDILCAYLQNDFIQQISHFGFRASQTALPCNTIRWQKSLDSSGGSSLRLSLIHILPGIAIFVAVVIFNLFGEKLRDALDLK